MLLQFTVRGQQIFRVDKTPLASDSRLYIAGAVDFDTEWDDITAIYLTFEPRNGTAITALLTDGAFDESLGVSLSAGTWRVSAHGTNTAGKEIHTTPVLLNVAQAGGRDGEAPPYVPPDAAGQIAAVAEEAREIAQSVRDDADEGLFKGEKGDKGDTGEKGDKGDKGDPGSNATVDIVTPTAESTDTQAASAKAVWDMLGTGGSGGTTVSDLKSILTDIVTFMKAVPFDDTVVSASDLDDIQNKIEALGSSGGTEEPVSATFSNGALAINGVTVNSATFTGGVLAIE